MAWGMAALLGFALAASACGRAGGEESGLKVAPLVQPRLDASAPAALPNPAATVPLPFAPASAPQSSTPAAPADTGPASAEVLETVLPDLKRRVPYLWTRENRLVEGHFSARLVTREGRKAMLIVLVDDLKPHAERLARAQRMPQRHNNLPAESAPGAWMRVLAYDRFLIEVRAENPTFADDTRIKEWLNQLRLEKLPRPEGTPRIRRRR